MNTLQLLDLEQCKLCGEPITEERKRLYGLHTTTCSQACSAEQRKTQTRLRQRTFVKRRKARLAQAETELVAA